MEIFAYVMDHLFSFVLLINSAIFLFQFSKIINRKSADDVSILTFAGFAAIQLITLIHGYLHRDYILLYGTSLSLISCVLVICAVMYFRLTKSIKKQNTILNGIEPSFEEIVSLIPANVYWIDRNGIFLGCNNHMLNMLNLNSVEEYRGKTYESFYEQSHIKIIKENDQMVMSSNTAITIEEVAAPYKVYLTNKIPLHDKGGRVIGLLGVSCDITQKKEMERALENAKKRAEVANFAKTEFLYNMRHDVRTPLANVVGLSKILFDWESNETKQAIIKDVVTSSESLMDLLNEMLEFSSIDEGIYPIKCFRFNLEDTMLKIQSIMSAAISNKGINFKINYKQSVPKIILGDQMRTHRILLNLVCNAVKNTDTGSIIIDVELFEENIRNYYIKITVEDTGKGIQNDKLDFIFGRFNKLSSSYSGVDPGTGLGLAIVKEFITDMDGEIHVESKVDVGSKFICVIPYLKPLEHPGDNLWKGENDGKLKENLVN